MQLDESIKVYLSKSMDPQRLYTSDELKDLMSGIVNDYFADHLDEASSEYLELVDGKYRLK